MFSSSSNFFFKKFCYVYSLPCITEQISSGILSSSLHGATQPLCNLVVNEFTWGFLCVLSACIHAWVCMRTTNTLSVWVHLFVNLCYSVWRQKLGGKYNLYHHARNWKICVFFWRSITQTKGQDRGTRPEEWCFLCFNPWWWRWHQQIFRAICIQNCSWGQTDR